MTSDVYLRSLLRQQELTPAIAQELHELRDLIQSQITVLNGAPRFYYAGSYAKGTLVREDFDLDIVAYWPATAGYNLGDIFQAVGEQLRRSWNIVNAKTVSWEVPFNDGFHIDVVPGRAIDATYYYANLYRRDTRTWMQTSIKKHIDSVRGSGRQEVIRLVKLWRTRNQLRLKSFVLEQLVIRGASGTRFDNLESQLVAALTFLAESAETARVVDPANSNNVLSDDISAGDLRAVALAAQWALNARSWQGVFEVPWRL